MSKNKNVKSNETKSDNNGSQSSKKKGLIGSLYNSTKETKENKDSNVLTEKDLLTKYKSNSPITLEDCKRLNKSTDNFLCNITDNIYGIDFVKFKLRDMESNSTLFEVSKPENSMSMQNINFLQDADDSSRFVRYNFASEFLRLKTVGALVEFKVGDVPVNNFYMLERHYFGEKLLKSFEFNFGFCVPNSRNTMEHIYQFPPLSESLIDEMIKNPYSTKSDTFYFVDNKLIMHNKADYSYTK